MSEITEKLKIKVIKGKEILDSNGKPTVAVEIKTNFGKFKAFVPSGVSKGKYEATELRDKDGRGVKKAIENIEKIIAPVLTKEEIKDQKKVDEILIQLDGTKNKSFLGANAILAVSMAVCRVIAAAKKIPLYRYIGEIYGKRVSEIFPRPVFNIINGGAHSKNKLDIQEFMIVPQHKRFSNNLKLGKKIYQELRQLVKKKFDKIKLGAEGGFSPPIFQSKEALELIKTASDGFKGIKIILDCAASHFQRRGKYQLEGKLLSKKELLNYYQQLLKEYPIIGLEDPFGQEDFGGWKKILNPKPQISNLLIIGDDLLATNPERIKMAQKKKLCNSVIVKINQIGTISEAIEAVKLAKLYGWKIIVSHRSGETDDDFISDFAVGIGADFIKAGAPATRERLAKYNRLLKIEKGLKYNF